MKKMMFADVGRKRNVTLKNTQAGRSVRTARIASALAQTRSLPTVGANMNVRQRSGLALLVLALVSTGLAQSRPLSLADAFAELEKANPSVLISREAVAQALAVTEQQRAGLLPKISLDAQQRRTQSVQFSNGTPFEQSPANRFDGKLTGNVALLNPAQIAAYRAARKGLAVAQLDERQTLQSVMSIVAQTYFGHMRNVQRIGVLDANITRARELRDLVRRQLAAGVVTQIDVTRAEAQLAIAEQARLQQDTTVFQSELQLKRLLDRALAEPLVLAGFEVTRTDQTVLPPDLEKNVLGQRSDYLRAVQAAEQNRDQVRAAGYQRFGVLSAVGEYGYATSRAFDGREKTAWLGGVAVTIPVFDGLKAGADRRVALAQLRAQELRVRALELQIPAELRLAAQDARSRHAQVSVAERNLALAQEQLRLAQIRFEGGAVDNREVIEAQNSLAIASDNRLEAVYQYNLSRLELARAKGDVRSILNEKAR
jgi:outer membrane protein